MAMRICPQCGTETQAPFCRADGFATVDSARYLARDPNSREGDTIAARYRLDQVLGKTALGSTYRATDLRLQTPVAVRLLASGIATDLGLIARFQREGRLVASLAHPNIVHVMEHGVAEDGTLYIAQELVSGPTLAEALSRSGRFDPTRVVALGREIFDALSEAHTHGVLHRSLGLDNIVLVTRAGGGESIKIGDFGLVHVLADDNAQPFNYPQVLSGAWRGMAPEQARGRGVSGHADLYSVGCILYELITGRPVFGDGSPSDLLVAHSVKMPPPLDRDGRILAGPLVELVMRCLEKKPWNRPDGAQKALDLLEVGRNQPILPLPSPTAEFAAPPANMGPQSRVKPRTNPYGHPSPTTTRTNPALTAVESTSMPTDPKGSARPKPQRHTREQPRPQTQSGQRVLPDAPRPETPKSMSEPTTVTRAPGSSAARAESHDRGFASRADLQLNLREPAGHDEPAKSRSPILWFVAGVVVAAVIAYLITSLGRDEPIAVGAPVEAPRAEVVPEAAETHVAAVEVQVETVAEPEVVAAVEVGPEVIAEVAAAEVVNEVVAAVDVVDARSEVRAAGDVRDATAPSETADTKADKADTKKDTKPVDPLADLEDPDLVKKVEAPMRKVLIDTEPIGAKIWIGGRMVGETPVYVEWQGEVDVLVAKQGFKPVRAHLGAGTGPALKYTLVPAQ